MDDSSAFLVRGDDGAEYGPVDLAELREWAAENRVGLGTQVRRDAPAAPWEPWQQYPELVALLAEVHVTGRVLPPLPPPVSVFAPMGRRSVAFVVDLFLSFVLVIGVTMFVYGWLPHEVIVQQTQFWLQYYVATLRDLPPPGQPPDLPAWYIAVDKLIAFALPTLYFACFHAAHGRTPAKSVLHLQVVDAQGRKPLFRKALLRGLILMISVNLFGLPLIYAFFNPQRRALHDIAAGTYVVEL